MHFLHHLGAQWEKSNKFVPLGKMKKKFFAIKLNFYVFYYASTIQKQQKKMQKLWAVY
jgi:hypothetical protein